MARKNKKKESFFRDNYKESFDYIQKSKIFIYCSVIFFFVFTFLGMFLQTPENIEQTILDLIEKILIQTEGLSLEGLISFIFLNNLQSAFFIVIFGIFFGIFPLAAILFNGYVLGFVAIRAAQIGGASVLLNLLPHGIFELPAIFISAGLGFKLGTFLFQKEKPYPFRIHLIKSLKVFVFVVIPLLIVAAIIEGILISL
ncbi:stage II sporulation protein M [Patescibacteria group bacterium]|nr:stage II sporulation protein M [Patescibacteria group bacterium]